MRLPLLAAAALGAGMATWNVFLLKRPDARWAIHEARAAQRGLAAQRTPEWETASQGRALSLTAVWIAAVLGLTVAGLWG